MKKLTLEQANTFDSQQELWQWLVEGNKCIWNKWVIGFKDNIFWNFTLNSKCNTVPEVIFNWIKYKEPEYITVNGFQVPKPINEIPKDLRNNWVYAPSFTTELMVEAFADEYLPEYLDMLLKREILHLSQEAAVIHAKALLEIKD